MTTNVMKAFEGGKLFKHISKFTYVLLYQVISLRITNTWMMIMMIGTTTVMMSYLRVVSYSSTGQRERDGGREEGGQHDLSLKAAKPTDPAHFGYFG